MIAAAQSSKPRARRTPDRNDFMSGHLPDFGRSGCTARPERTPSDLGPIVSPARAREACERRNANSMRYPVKTSISRGLSFCRRRRLPVGVDGTVPKKSRPTNWDGLEIRKIKGLDLVYVRPNVEFAPYKSVMLEPNAGRVPKNWEKNQRINTLSDSGALPAPKTCRRSRRSLSELMREGFTEELTKHGYTVVDTPAEDTLHVRTAIINLLINAPDTARSRHHSHVHHQRGLDDAGARSARRTDGQLLARVVDARSDDSAGGNSSGQLRQRTPGDAKP